MLQARTGRPTRLRCWAVPEPNNLRQENIHLKPPKSYRIERLLDAYRAGQLSQAEVDQLWLEMLEHPEYLEDLKNAVNLEAIAEEYKNETITGYAAEKKSSARLFIQYRSWVPWAAAVVLLTGVLSLFTLFRDSSFLDPQPLHEIELNQFRTSAVPEVVFERDLQKAVHLASKEEYDEAMSLIDELSAKDLTEDQRINLLVNRGSIYYNRGDYYAARETFERILQEYEALHILTREQTHWFLANTYLQIRRPEQAAIHMKKTFELNGAYRRLAERHLLDMAQEP